MLQARIEQLEEQFKVLQQRLDQGSTSSGRTTSRSIGTDPPPTPLIISDSPGLTGVGGILLTSSAVMTTMPSTSPAFGFRWLEHSPSGPSNYAFPAVPRDSSADVEFDGLMKVMVNRPDSDYTTSPMAHQPSLNAVPPIDVPPVNSPVTTNPHPPTPPIVEDPAPMPDSQSPPERVLPSPPQVNNPKDTPLPVAMPNPPPTPTGECSEATASNGSQTDNAGLCSNPTGSAPPGPDSSPTVVAITSESGVDVNMGSIHAEATDAGTITSFTNPADTASSEAIQPTNVSKNADTAACNPVAMDIGLKATDVMEE
jgi:hypothetical protein